MKQSLLSRVMRRLLLEWDAYKWARATKAFRVEQKLRNGGKKRLLICDLLAMTGGVKTEAIFAGAIACSGYKTTVLLTRPDRILEKIYRSAVYDVEFVYLEDYFDDAEDVQLVEATNTLLHQNEFSIQRLLSYEKDGVRIGKNALSLAIRQLRVGELDVSKDKHLRVIKEAFSYSLKAAEAAQKLVSEIKPDKSLFNERGYTPAGEVFDACLLFGGQAIQWFGAPRADELIFKRYSLDNRSDHPMSLSDRTWDYVQSFSWGEDKNDVVSERIWSNYEEDGSYNRQKLQEGKNKFSSSEVIDLLEIDPNKKTAVIFAHILYDATFFYGESLYDDYQHWLIEAVRCAIRNPALNWIIKVHPVNVWRSKMDGAALEQLELIALEREFGVLPDHIRVMRADTSINTASLFGVLDYALTVRGTIGMELPCFGVPVVTAGTGRYSGRGFTIDPGTREEFKLTLENLHKLEPLSEKQVNLAVCHYFTTAIERPWKFESFILDFDSHTYGLSELSLDCFFQKKNAQRNGIGDDLVKLSNWFSSSEDIDLIN